MMLRVEASGNLISLMREDGVLSALRFVNKDVMVALMARSTALLASSKAR